MLYASPFKRAIPILYTYLKWISLLSCKYKVNHYAILEPIEIVDFDEEYMSKPADKKIRIEATEEDDIDSLPPDYEEL